MSKGPKSAAGIQPGQGLVGAIALSTVHLLIGGGLLLLLLKIVPSYERMFAELSNVKTDRNLLAGLFVEVAKWLPDRLFRVAFSNRALWLITSDQLVLGEGH